MMASLPRRAAQLLLSLSDTPEAQLTLRPHEWRLMHFAINDHLNAGALVGETLELLSSD